MSKFVEIHTDGSALDNGKPYARCGAGVVLIYKGVLKELSEPLPNYKTNNQSEVYAAILALSKLKEPCKVILYSDSEYMRRGITEWMEGWKRRGWKTANKGAPVKNKDLWVELDRLVNIHDVTFIWEQGHAGNFYNERADYLARSAAESLEKEGK